MRIGIFVSGQIRGSLEQLNLNINLLRNGFPEADIIYGVWDYQVEEYQDFLNTLNGNVEILEHFEIHYSPYVENPKASNHYQYHKKLKNPSDRHLHQTKQILIHNELVKRYAGIYDVIVRCRWDTTVSPALDFTTYAKEVYNTPCTMSICTRGDYFTSVVHIGEKASWDFPMMNHRRADGVAVIRQVEDMFLDSGLVLHRYDDWNSKFIEQLHTDKKLLAAEFGWWQVMVHGTSHHQWVHYDGGASITRTVHKKELEQIERIML